MKYKAIIDTDDYKGFEFFEDAIGKYMVGKDASVTAHGGWIPLYFTEVKEETVTEFADRCKECSKVNKKKVYRDCRDAFVEAVEKVFTDTDAFLDFIEHDDFSSNYDFFVTRNDECYIINRNTGEYINWYKFTHLGRDIHSTVNPDKFEEFLQKFYDSRLWN